MAVAIQFRHDDAAVWLEEDPILLEGEVGVELDTDLFKIGDGETLWHNLPYANRGLTGEKGDKGDKGDTGATGALSTVPGPAGADGRTVLNGAGAPGAGTGVNGDFYINLSAITIYGPKTGGAWGSPTSIIGPKGDKGDQGETGTAGFSFLSGTDVPGGGLGVNGDFYIDTTNKTLYGPKTGGAWGSLASLIGERGEKGDIGDKGDRGDKGDDGIDGTMILSGTGDPPSPTGLADGTIYIKYTA